MILYQVQCPSELYQATGMRRSDEPVQGFVCNNPPFEPSGGHLFRLMDCAKPFYAFPFGVGSFYPGQNLVVSCKRDGYSRINSVPTEPPTAMPTIAPTGSERPSALSTVAPSNRLPTLEPSTAAPSQFVTAEPTSDAMCCPNTVYGPEVWPYCMNGAYASVTAGVTCDNTCLSYQCLDWNLLSSGMTVSYLAAKIKLIRYL